MIFAFHGYPWVIHRLTYRRHNHDNIHVRGYKEEGTTTTPFDMCVLNNIDRFQLTLDAIMRVPRLASRHEEARQVVLRTIQRHQLYVAENGDDLPEIRNWLWPQSGEPANRGYCRDRAYGMIHPDPLTCCICPAPSTRPFYRSCHLACTGSEQRFLLHQVLRLRSGQRPAPKLHEGAVDGIGTDQGKFWIKDADGKKLVDQTPALPTRAVAFALVADALHSGDFPAPAAIGHRMVCGGPTVQENQLHHACADR